MNLFMISLQPLFIFVLNDQIGDGILETNSHIFATWILMSGCWLKGFLYWDIENFKKIYFSKRLRILRIVVLQSRKCCNFVIEKIMWIRNWQVVIFHIRCITWFWLYEISEFAFVKSWILYLTKYLISGFELSKFCTCKNQ